MQRMLSTTKIPTAPIAIPTTTPVDKLGDPPEGGAGSEELGGGGELRVGFVGVDGVEGVFDRDGGGGELDGVEGVPDGVEGGGGEADELGGVAVAGGEGVVGAGVVGAGGEGVAEGGGDVAAGGG